MAAKELTFECRSDFRNWLEAHCASDEGVWLIFGKAGGPKTLTASEALEEALCFGWIDGQMQKIDDAAYRKILLPTTRQRQMVGEEQEAGCGS